jgi:hypothetical protein
MQTVIYRDIDGLKIISGFGRLVIDPIETGKAVKAAMSETPEAKAIASKQDELEEKLALVKSSYEKAGKALKAKKQAESDKYAAEYRIAAEAVEKIMAELRTLLPALEEARIRLTKDLAIYFIPKNGEIHKTDAEISVIRTKLQSLEDGSFLSLDGKEIADLRGKSYLTKKSGRWQHLSISILGEKFPAGAKQIDALTDADRGEIEAQRISELSAGQKQDERATAEISALNEAAFMKHRLEVQGSDDPLAESQAWYKNTMDELAKKYK